MPRRLRKLHVTRVDRVADPANPDSRIVLFKSASDPNPDQGDTDMADEPTNILDLDDEAAVTAFLEAMMALREEDDPSGDDSGEPAEITDEAIAEAIAEMDTDALIAASKGRVAKAAPKDDGPDAMAEFLKSAPPEVAQAFEKARENEIRIAKMEAAARLDQFVAVAKSEMPALTETPDVVGQVLADVAAALGSDDHELVKTLQRVLKAASAQAELADDVITKAKGKDGESVAADSAQGEIERRATELAKSANISIVQATRQVIDADPALLTKHLSGS
jgi:hypothetical protein